MTHDLEQKIHWYNEEYLDTPAGQQHLAFVESELQDVKKIFAEIREKYQTEQDITDDVLRRLLPHTNSSFHRENDYRISTWPCIQKDVKSWFEGAGWKKPEDWTPTAHLIFEAIDGIIQRNSEPWERFLNSPYRHGFGTGFISPILFCLDETYPVINSKVVKTYRYCTEQFGQRDEIDAKLVNYLDNAKKVKQLVERLGPLGIQNQRTFDIFCHYLVSKRLGGGDFTKATTLDYVAWLFVANPDIFKWKEAFANNGVNWTGSKGAYAQKLLRQQQLRPNDRVFGYQAGPDYKIICELKVATSPQKTAQGTWSVELSPVYWLDTPIPRTVLKDHSVLSKLKFMQQTQMSISGITTNQLAALDELISKPDIQSELSGIDRLCHNLLKAQNDTSNPDHFELLLADALALLGFESEHLGGPGKPDVLATAFLGSDSYSVVIEAKTCSVGKTLGLGQVDYASIQEHREEHSADYALLIAPAFSTGKLVDRARNDKVGMMTTEFLVAIMRQHDLFPFSLVELRRLFECHGPVDGLEAEIERVHLQHINYLQLAGIVLQVFDEFQRQQDISEPISSHSIYYLLLGRAQQSQVALDRTQIDQVLALLSNPILDILAKKDEGYVLTLSPDAARQRLVALESLITEPDV